MPKPPRPKPRFPDEFDREDELQEYQLTAARLRDASPETIQRCTKERWGKHWNKDKRKSDPKLTREQLVDAAGWDCFQEAEGGEDLEILRQDVRRAIDTACEVYPRPVVLAACELMTISQAASACHQRKETVCTRVKDARELLQGLLRDYEEDG